MQATNDNNYTAIPDALLDKIVGLMNANLSPFVVKCLDIEAEKRYIASEIGEDFVQLTQENRALKAELEQVKLSREELYNQLEIAQATNVIPEDVPESVKLELQQATEMIASIKSQRQEMLVSLEREHQLRVELERELEMLRAEKPSEKVEEEENWMQYTLPDVPVERAPKAKRVVEESPIEESPEVDDSQMTLW